MTKIGYIADVHVGNFSRWPGITAAGVNERAQHVLDALERAMVLVQECHAFGVLGDLFDYVHVEPQIIAAVQRELDCGVPGFVMVGNHDQKSTAIGDNAVAPLDPVVSVIERPRRFAVHDVDVWAVPFHPGPVQDWLPSALDDFQMQTSSGTTHRHLCLHMGIAEPGMPEFLTKSSGAIDVDALFDLMERYSIDVAVSGDWHRHKIWRRGHRAVCQVGALAPNRFPPGDHEQADRGPLVIVEGADIHVHDVPGPRFYTARWGETWTPAATQMPTYLRVRCKEGEEAEARAWLAEHKAAGFVREYALDVDRAHKIAAARTAAHDARTASSVDEAIRVFVERMAVEDGVDRAAVLRRVRGFLG